MPNLSAPFGANIEGNEFGANIKGNDYETLCY
jgi:hypothetical protein